MSVGCDLYLCHSTSRAFVAAETAMTSEGATRVGQGEGVTAEFSRFEHITVGSLYMLFGTFFQSGRRRDSLLLVEHRTRDLKVASSNRGRAAGAFSSPELTFCADSYSVYVPPPCYRSYTHKTPVILPKVKMADYT